MSTTPEQDERLVRRLHELVQWTTALATQIARIEAEYAIELQLRHGFDIAVPERRSAAEMAARFGRSADEHFLWVAGNQLVRAWKSVPARFREAAELSERTLGVLEAFRHYVEHPESRQRSSSDPVPARLREARALLGVDDAAPGITQWSIHDGLTIAGAVHLPTLLDEIRRVHNLAIDWLDQLEPPLWADNFVPYTWHRL